MQLIDNQIHAIYRTQIANEQANMSIMINERTALVMLDGEVPNDPGDPHHTRQFYKSVQAFADITMKLCEEGRYQKFEKFWTLACKLFREGNETVKNGIVNVYLFTLSRSIDKHPLARKIVDELMPRELKSEYVRLHYASGM